MLNLTAKQVNVYAKLNFSAEVLKFHSAKKVVIFCYNNFKLLLNTNVLNS